MHKPSLGCALSLLLISGCATPVPTTPLERDSRALASSMGSCTKSPLALAAGPQDPRRSGSGIVVAGPADDRIALVADADSRSVSAFSVARQELLSTTWLEEVPDQLLVLDDGRVAVALMSTSEVAVFEARGSYGKPLSQLCKREVGAEPRGLARGAEGDLLVVSRQHGLSRLAASDLTVRSRVALPRDPRSVLRTDNGAVYVSHMVGAELSMVDAEGSGKLKSVALGLRAASPFGESPNRPRRGAWGYSLAAVDLGEHRRLLSPMVSVDPGDAERQLSNYYGPPADAVAKQVPTVVAVDVERVAAVTREVFATQRGAQLRACLLPRAAAAHAKKLYVACQGIDALLELDASALDPMAAELRRFSLPAGPNAVAIEGSQALVFSQYGASLSFVDLESGGEPVVKRVDYRPTADLVPLLEGRVLFHRTDDTRIANDGLACASCHPEARDDSLSWSTPQGLRQTLPLAGRLASTAPYGWEGEQETVTGYIGNTVGRLGGKGITHLEVSALATYLQGVAPPPAAVRHSDTTLRGKDLFFDLSVGCGTCHLGSQGVDSAKHTLDRGPDATGFDTPSLRGVALSAPYFHDGRYATLEALLSDTRSDMGAAHALGPEDRAALLGYLEQL